VGTSTAATTTAAATTATTATAFGGHAGTALGDGILHGAVPTLGRRTIAAGRSSSTGAFIDGPVAAARCPTTAAAATGTGCRPATIAAPGTLPGAVTTTAGIVAVSAACASGARGG